MDANQLEARLQETASAPRITQKHINEMLQRVTYKTEVPAGTTSTFVHAFLDDKFYLATGHSACVSPENFNAQIGQALATEQATKKAEARLWELEGYRLYALRNFHLFATKEAA